VTPEEVLDTSLEGAGVDRGKAVQLRLDLIECGPQPLALDKSAREHGAHGFEVPPAAPFELRECLGVEVEVLERELALAPYGRAQLLPAGGEGMKIPRRSELDLDARLVLDSRERSPRRGRARRTP
jgi:hypothetical protein